MSSFVKKIPDIFKKPKILLILGLSGIFLIFISSFFPSGEKKAAEVKEDMNAQEYRDIIQKSVCNIVTGITGDKKPTVVVTLESGVKYSYADSKESDTSASTNKESEENRKATKQSYITVKTSDGGEKPLVVTEIMPDIRGVAIVCELGDSPAVSEKIQNAVTAALNITSQRVYVSGGISNEKG